MVWSLTVLMVLLGGVIQPHYFRQPHPIVHGGQMAPLDGEFAQPIAAPSQVTAVVPAAKKKTQASPQKQIAANGTRRQTPDRTALPKQPSRGNEDSTVLAFEKDYFADYRSWQERSMRQHLHSF